MPLGNPVLRRVRPTPTLPLSTTFPCTSGDLLHEQGEIWGQNLSTGNAVIIDPRRYIPAHLALGAAARRHLRAVRRRLRRPDQPVQDPAPFDLKRLDDDMRRPVTSKISFLQSLFEMMAHPGDRMPAEERSLLEAPQTDDVRSVRDDRRLGEHR